MQNNYDTKGNYIVLNTEKGLYVYDAAHKEYAVLLESEGTPCGYTLQGTDGTLYARAWESAVDTGEYTVYLIKEKK